MLAGAGMIAVVALALTGCGRPGGGASLAGGGPSEAISDDPIEGTITVWAMGAEGEALPDFVADFEAENPGVTVDVTPIPWDGAHDRIANAIAGGQTPDISMIGTTWVGEFAASGALDAVPEGLVEEADFFEGAWQTGVVNDTAYSVPWYVETRVLYTNEQLAEEAGVQPPADWSEVLDFGEAMRGAGAEVGVYIPPGGVDLNLEFLPWVWEAGGDIMNDDGTEFTMDTEEWVTALEMYREFSQRGIASGEAAIPGGELEPAFANGEVGSFFGAPYQLGVIQNDLGFTDFSLSLRPAEKSATSFIGGSNWSVFEATDARDASWRFVEWMSEPETQAAWFETINSLPAVQDAWPVAGIDSDPQMAVFGEQLQDAKAPPAIPTWAQIASVLDTEIERVVKGVKSPERAVEDIQRQAELIGTGL